MPRRGRSAATAGGGPVHAPFTVAHLTHGGARQHHNCVGRHTFGRSPGAARRTSTGGCVDARPKVAARGGSLGRPPSFGRPSGRPAPPRRRRQGGTDGGVTRTSPRIWRSFTTRTSSDPFHVEQHGIDFIPESERWATPEGHLRHVGRRQRAGRVLHLRRHPDDLRVDLRPGRSSLIVLGNLSYLPARAVLAAGTERRDDGLRHQPGRRSGPTARGRSPSSTGSPRSASRSRASSSSSAPAWC